MPILDSTSPRSPEDRQAIADLLNPCVASGIDLYLDAKLAHWNVRGPAFGPLHALFEQVASTVTERTDMIAERVAQNGALAVGNAAQVSEGSRLTEYPVDVRDGFEHCRLLVERIREMVALLSETRNACDDMLAVDTVQLLSDTVLVLDKLGWMLVAHLQ